MAQSQGGQVVSRYKYTKLRNLGPVHGFLIRTPDDRTLKDLYPQFIVRELNRMADRINKLQEAGDAMMSEPCEYTFEQWIKAKEAKP